MAHWAKRAHGRGQVWKDDERGCYRGQVTINGKRRSVSGKEGECHRALDALLDGAEEECPEADAKVGEWLTLWVEELAKTNCEGTRQNRRDMIKRWRPLFRMKMSAVLSPDVERVLKADAAAGYSKSTLVRMKSVLKMGFDAWNGRTRHSFNPAQLAKLPDTKPRRKKTSVTAEQAAALLEVAEATPRYGLLVTLGIWLGLRPGEVAGLTWANVDLDAGELSVVQTRRRNPDGTYTMTTPKADSYRNLVLPGPVVEALRSHKAAQARERLRARRWENTELVICTPTGRPLHPSSQRDEVARMARAAGIFDREVCPNELRHTMASLMVETTRDLTKTADALGHKNERMLIETYRDRLARTVDTSDAMTAALGA